MNTMNHSFNQLHRIIRQLRSSEGCPWDRKQTVPSLKKYLQEEFNEIIEAIDNDDSENLCEELGDFLYLILMIADISEEHGLFSINDVTVSINEKLLRRHPHVFGNQVELDEDELQKQWQSIKEAEKANKSP